MKAWIHVLKYRLLNEMVVGHLFVFSGASVTRVEVGLRCRFFSVLYSLVINLSLMSIVNFLIIY